MFKVGRVYQRQKIHDLFGGERQKGISRPVTTPSSCFLIMEAKFLASATVGSTLARSNILARDQKEI